MRGENRVLEVARSHVYIVVSDRSRDFDSIINLDGGALS